MAMSEHADQDFVEFVVKAIVDNPQTVSTTRTVDEMGVLITLHVDANDLGQVIGRQGQTAKAIRTLLRVVGAKHQARVNLKIYEPEGSHRPAVGNNSGNTNNDFVTPSITSEPTTSAIDNIDI